MKATNILVTVSGKTTRVEFDRPVDGRVIITDTALLAEGTVKVYGVFSTPDGVVAMVARDRREIDAERKLVRSTYPVGSCRAVMTDEGAWDLEHMLRDL